MIFKASPNTIAAARAKTGVSPGETALDWGNAGGTDPEDPAK
jgi:hypothetical protein